jgi:hypothetical protein
MPKPPDETKDAQFQNVVQHFLKTPPKPFTPKAKKAPSPKKAKAKKAKA